MVGERSDRLGSGKVQAIQGCHLFVSVDGDAREFHGWRGHYSEGGLAEPATLPNPSYMPRQLGISSLIFVYRHGS